MKIILKGPHKNWLDSRTWVNMWAKLFGFEEDFEYMDRMETNWDQTWIGRKQEKLCKWYSRYTRHWDSKPDLIHIDGWDVWNMDTTLSHIIHAMLVKLKEEKHGSPRVDPEDVPEHLRPKESPNAENGYSDDTWHERWEWVLDELIWTFENCTKDEYDVPGIYTGQFDMDFDESEKGVFKMVAGPNHTQVYHKEVAKAWRERRQNGLRLFAKYYFGLWD